MARTYDTAPPARRRRSDARRSVEAILGAARTVFSERPDAGMEDIARAAGVTRQTVYAHFPSRDALISTLVRAAGEETLADLDAAGLDAAPPAEALRRFLAISWELIRRHPYLLAPALAQDPPGARDSHDAGAVRLEQLIRRGQHTRDFESTLPAPWLVEAIVGLTRTAAEQVAAGNLTADDAADLLQDSSLRLCGAVA